MHLDPRSPLDPTATLRATTDHRRRLPAAAGLALTAMAAACSPEGRPALSADASSLVASPAPATLSSPLSSRTLTLITGDQVRATRLPGGHEVYTAVPGPGRNVRFVQTRNGETGEVSVIPSDATSFLAAGSLDPRLFRVSDLFRDGYDDGHRSTLPLIVTYRDGRAATRATAISLRGAALARALPSISGAALIENKSEAGAFWESLTSSGTGRGGRGSTGMALAANTGIAKVWLDGRARPLLDASVPQIGTSAAWQRGYTGKGVTIAVLDTGVRLDHPDLADRVAESKDFTGTLPSGDDDIGHGTHVAGAIAGTGAASAGKYRGVAPEATLISGKVCEAEGCSESAIIAGMEWAAAKARIVNLSLGGDPTDGTDPVSLALNRLTAAHGTLFVVAAGNEGGNSGGVGAPASADAALAVASVTKRDEMSAFSSRGPRIDHVIKPDVAAPGSSIIAARARGTELGDDEPVDEHHAVMSGTSMATPHVAGAAALLAQAHPTWLAAELKAALMTTSLPLATASIYDQGVGRIDVDRATSQPVFATTPSVSFGQLPWPHTQPPVTRTVTYRNDSTSAVTLDLALDVVDAERAAAPAGMFTLGATQITVAARDTAAVAVTLTPLRGRAGLFGGVLTASSGPIRVAVAVGTDFAPESYDLRINAIPRQPGPLETMGFVVDVATRRARPIGPFSEQMVVRLPKGRYDVLAYATSYEHETTSLLHQLAVPVERDTAITLDERDGRPLAVTVDRPSPELRAITTSIASSGSSMGTSTMPSFFVVPSAQVDDQRLTFDVGVVLSSPDAAEPPARAGSSAGNASDDEPYRYNLVFTSRGQIPEPTYRVRDTELASHRVRYHVQGVATSGERCDIPLRATVGSSCAFVPLPELPRRMTEYFSARDDVLWSHSTVLTSADEDVLRRSEAVLSVPTRYQPGQILDDDWNRAPIGPAFGDDQFRALRSGAIITATLPLFSSSEAHHYTDSAAVAIDTAGGISGTTTLSKDGVVLGTSNVPGLGEFRVPAEAATYTLRTGATRENPFSLLATRLDATWTFRSSEIGDEEVALPLLAVRASGPVDDSGVAGGGQDFPLSLHVQRQPGAAPAALADLTLEVSYDDGATWQATPVERTADGGIATLQHPAGDHFASLRMTARDAEGNAVTHTTVRAYQIRGTGPTPVPDAGATPSPDAGATGPNPRPDPDDGCGCAAAAGSGTPGQTIASLLLVLATAWRLGQRRRVAARPRRGQRGRQRGAGAPGAILRPLRNAAQTFSSSLSGTAALSAVTHEICARTAIFWSGSRSIAGAAVIRCIREASPSRTTLPSNGAFAATSLSQNSR